MGRLDQLSLFNPETAAEHMFRERRVEILGVGCDTSNPNAVWETLPERIAEEDPDGRRSYALLLSEEEAMRRLDSVLSFERAEQLVFPYMKEETFEETAARRGGVRRIYDSLQARAIREPIYAMRKHY